MKMHTRRKRGAPPKRKRSEVPKITRSPDATAKDFFIAIIRFFILLSLVISGAYLLFENFDIGVEQILKAVVSVIAIAIFYIIFQAPIDAIFELIAAALEILADIIDVIGETLDLITCLVILTIISIIGGLIALIILI